MTENNWLRTLAALAGLIFVCWTGARVLSSVLDHMNVRSHKGRVQAHEPLDTCQDRVYRGRLAMANSGPSEVSCDPGARASNRLEKDEDGDFWWVATCTCPTVRHQGGPPAPAPGGDGSAPGLVLPPTAVGGVTAPADPTPKPEPGSGE